MPADSGVYNADHLWFPVISVSFMAGTATRNFYFKPLRRMQIMLLQASADAADATDKFTPSLTNVTTSDTIITGSVVQAADTIVDVTAVDSGKSNILLPGHTYRLTLTFAGTPANVLGGHVALWAKTASH